MSKPLRLLCSVAHPDDESMGTGGVLAKYAAEGVETYIVMGTRGERGWGGDPAANPGMEALGKVREAELAAAAQALGVYEVNHLNYIDGDLDRADPQEIIAKIAYHIRRIQPQVIVTFGPDGAYGHPDHIAMSQFTMAACLAAADPAFTVADGPEPPSLEPYRVDKFYYMVDSRDLLELVDSLAGEYTFNVDGVQRRQVAWEDWMITTRIDTSDYWRTVAQAVACHRSQLYGVFSTYDQWPEERHIKIWGRSNFYRAFSLVNGGRSLETDLFAGLR
jgi:LmbE family N-acetylglucosaminyl deacetylase